MNIYAHRFSGGIVHVFSYDRTFAGLLSALFDAYTRKTFPELLLGADELPPLSASSLHAVTTSAEKADRVLRGLRLRLSAEGQSRLFLAWLAEETGGDLRIFRFMRKVFDAPAGLEQDLADPDVFAVDGLVRKVRGEQHRLTGFARFQKTAQGVYFAPLRPRHNVLPLLLPHFIRRFGDQPFVLYDVGRCFGLHHALGRTQELFLDPGTVRDLDRKGGRLPGPLLAEDEEQFQELWKAYFASACIRERRNSALHSRCLPRRYWPYLTEKQPPKTGCK